MPYYNQIDDSSNAYVLWKNSDHKPIGGINFKNIYIEWGKGKDNVIRIRKLHYPKENYNVMDIMKIARKTVNCPFCKVGKELTPIPNSDFDKYLNTNDGVNSNMGFMDNLQQTLDPTRLLEKGLDLSEKGLGMAGMNANAASSIATTVVPQIAAKIPQAFTGYITSPLGRKFVDGLVGIAGLAALIRFGGKMSPRMNDAGTAFFGNFVANLFNTEKGAMFSINADLQKLRESISFGDGKGAMNAFFDPAGFEKLRADLRLPTTFRLPSLNFGKFGFGAKLEAPKVTQSPNAQKMLPSGFPTSKIPFRFNKI